MCGRFGEVMRVQHMELCHMIDAQTFNTRKFSTRQTYRFFDYNSAPSRSSETISRQILPIITPELPIPPGA